MEIIIPLLLVISSIINIAFSIENGRNTRTIKRFAETSIAFMVAFEEIQKVVNENAKIYSRWGKMINHHNDIFVRMFGILEVYALALKLTPPSLTILEDSEER